MLKLLLLTTMIFALAISQESESSDLTTTSSGESVTTSSESSGESVTTAISESSGESLTTTSSSESGESVTTTSSGESVTTTSSGESATTDSESDSESSITTTADEAVTTTADEVVTTTTTIGTVSHNSDYVSNYYYAPFGTATYFAYAIDKCTASSFTLYTYATCLNTTHLQVDTYQVGTCSGTPYSSKIYTSATATFRCSGVNAYAYVVIYTSCPITSGFGVYSALNVCSFSGTVYSSVYCSSDTYAELQYYSGSTCADNTITAISTATDTCKSLFTLGTTVVYGQMEDCSTLGYDTTVAADTTTTKDSANTIYNIYNTFFLLFITFGIITLQL